MNCCTVTVFIWDDNFFLISKAKLSEGFAQEINFPYRHPQYHEKENQCYFMRYIGIEKNVYTCIIWICGYIAKVINCVLLII